MNYVNNLRASEDAYFFTKQLSEVVDNVMKHEDAYNDRQAGMSYKEIAEKYGVTESAVKSWNSRYWTKGKVATSASKVATKRKKAGAPLRNQNAVKHGLFAKYLPSETLEIVADIEEASPLDILWANIQIKFAAILRAQKLMHVKAVDDHLGVTSTESTIKSAGASVEKRVVKKEEVISSIEREEKFLYAQSRAMDTLLRLIKQYDDMCHGDLATEEAQARIDKLKAEVATIRKNEDGPTEQDMSSYVEALRGEVTEVWADEEE